MARTRSRTRAVHQTPKVETRDIIELFPYENNPRDNEEAVQSVANSIQNFGFLVPIVVDSSNVIVAGHTRYEAAKTLGLQDVPVIVATHLTADQIAAFRLVDNKVSELARWDFDALASELSALENSGIRFTEFGWSQEEIDCLTDVVSDDCLSAGSVTSMENEQGRRRAEQRAPSQSRFVLAEFVFFTSTDVMRRWAQQIRVECDYDEAEIAAHLKDLLGITPYEQEN
jgi:hypothetical protein